MTEIILIRHGESMGNRKKVFLGHTDWDLTEKGYKQAELTAKYIDKYNIDVIYASDLKRAYNTAAAVAKRRGMEIIKTKEFREIYAGEWEGREYKDINENYPKDRYIWDNDIGNARCTGGESVRELQERVVREFNRIANLHKGKTVLIGTHATPIRVLKCFLLGKDIKYTKEIPWSVNASVTVVDAESKRIILDGYSEHLGELLVEPSSKM